MQSWGHVDPFAVLPRLLSSLSRQGSLLAHSPPTLIQTSTPGFSVINPLYCALCMNECRSALDFSKIFLWKYSKIFQNISISKIFTLHEWMQKRTRFFKNIFQKYFKNIFTIVSGREDALWYNFFLVLPSLWEESGFQARSAIWEYNNCLKHSWLFMYQLSPLENKGI